MSPVLDLVCCLYFMCGVFFECSLCVVLLYCCCCVLLLLCVVGGGGGGDPPPWLHISSLSHQGAVGMEMLFPMLFDVV